MREGGEEEGVADKGKLGVCTWRRVIFAVASSGGGGAGRGHQNKPNMQQDALKQRATSNLVPEFKTIKKQQKKKQIQSELVLNDARIARLLLIFKRGAAFRGVTHGRLV